MTDTPAPEHASLGRAERKLATVLFADLVSSTERGASEDPERTRMLLDRFYDAMTAELVTAGGTVEKFVGDAVMAAFGVPLAQEDHVERALHAALAMRRRLEQTFGGELALRIGVNSGEVVVGTAREGSSFVSGDAVNVAARLEQAAGPSEILVGERAAALAVGAFELEAPMVVEAKGKRGGVECRRLVRALSLMRPRGVPGLKPVFVGRDRELDLLREAFARASERGEPQLVTIMGEPGVGKTRVARELWEWLGGRQAPAMRLAGRCVPYGLATTYAPIGEVLREHFGILESDSTERVLGLLGERELLGLALGLDVAGALHPLEARDRLHDAWVDFVSELAGERPLVLLVEDLHWGQEALFELLERTLLETQAHLLLVATARPEFLDLSPTWGRGRVASGWIWLEPLTADDVERLVAGAAADLPPAARDVLGRAEGNPLFVEELLATFIERGALDIDGGWDVAQVPSDAALPDSVHAVLAARIDLLPPEERAGLQAAAVIGRAFWPSAVRALLGGSVLDLGALERRDFVRRGPGSSLEGEREYVFKHALTREVAYGSLTRRDRAHLHGDFGAWLEDRGAGRDEDVGRLALHYAEAVRPEDADLAWGDEPGRYEELRRKAVTWLPRAAELAAGRYEIADALALLDRALALELDRDEKVEILQQAGYTHTLRYDMQGFRDAMEEALSLELEQEVAAVIYARLAYFSLARPYMWKRPPSRELAEEWLGRAVELSEPGTEARGLVALAQALSRPETGAQAAEEALAIGEKLAQSPVLLGSAHEAKALVAAAAGDYEEASTWADRSLDIAIRTSDPGYRATRLWGAGLAHLRAGRIGDVRRLAEEQSRIAPSIGPHDEVHALAHLAVLESVLGRWDALADLATRAETTASANAEFPCQFNWRTLIVCALGAAHLDRGDEVDRLLELGREGAVVVGPAEREPALLRLALLRNELDEVERILALLPRAIDHWGLDADAARLDALAALGRRAEVETEAARFLERESYTRPFALRALGIVRRDASLLDAAADRFQDMGLEWRATETRRMATNGRPGAAS